VSEATAPRARAKGVEEVDAQGEVLGRAGLLSEVVARDLDGGRAQVDAERVDAVRGDESGVAALCVRTSELKPAELRRAEGEGRTLPQPATSALPSLSESSETPTSAQRSSRSSRKAGWTSPASQGVALAFHAWSQPVRGKRGRELRQLRGAWRRGEEKSRDAPPVGDWPSVGSLPSSSRTLRSEADGAGAGMARTDEDEVGKVEARGAHRACVVECEVVWWYVRL